MGNPRVWFRWMMAGVEKEGAGEKGGPKEARRRRRWRWRWRWISDWLHVRTTEGSVGEWSGDRSFKFW